MERTWRRLLIVVRACRFVRGAGGLWNGVWEFKGTPQPPVLCVMSNIRHGACWCITAYPRVRREPCTPAATRSISNEPPRRRRDVDVTARRGGVRFRHAGGAQGCDLRVRLMRVGLF